MDKYIDGLVDNIVAQVKKGLVDVEAMFSIENGLPLELNKKQCAKMFGIDTSTFDTRFNSHKDFPRIEGAREKYPRDAVIEWYHKNWKKTGV